MILDARCQTRRVRQVARAPASPWTGDAKRKRQNRWHQPIWTGTCRLMRRSFRLSLDARPPGAGAAGTPSPPRPICPGTKADGMNRGEGTIRRLEAHPLKPDRYFEGGRIRDLAILAHIVRNVPGTGLPACCKWYLFAYVCHVIAAPKFSRTSRGAP